MKFKKIGKWRPDKKSISPIHILHICDNGSIIIDYKKKEDFKVIVEGKKVIIALKEKL